MKKSKFTDQQIAFALKQAETGTPVKEVIRKLGITEQVTCPALGMGALAAMGEFGRFDGRIFKSVEQKPGLVVQKFAGKALGR
jgi:hypothetical protein